MRYTSRKIARVLAFSGVAAALSGCVATSPVDSEDTAEPDCCVDDVAALDTLPDSDDTGGSDVALNDAAPDSPEDAVTADAEDSTDDAGEVDNEVDAAADDAPPETTDADDMADAGDGVDAEDTSAPDGDDDDDAVGDDADGEDDATSADAPDAATDTEADTAEDTATDTEADTASDVATDSGTAPRWEHATFGASIAIVFASELEQAHAVSLAAEALAGLGFGADAPDGPRSGDQVVVTRHLVAWLDGTGFVGKLQGLWLLDGAEAPGFVLRDVDGRPINFFIVGEDGRGEWPAGYVGSEHLEFPNRTPEPNDPPACATRDWCNQYGVAEATWITDPDIPWWSACNASHPPYTDVFTPLVVSDDDAFEILWESRLVKQADGDSNRDGDECGADWLFADGSRRPVYVQLGFRFDADAARIERIARFRNPAGNPAFDGPMSLIGGFVLTDWPNPHPLKQLQRWLRPETRDVADPVSGATLVGGAWTRHDHARPSGDEIFAWLGQPLSMSASPSYVAGASVRMSHESGIDDDDVGACLCSVHGGLEIGGGFLHSGISLPVAPGATSPWAVRVLQFPNDTQVVRRDYRMGEHGHGTGRADGSAWLATVADDAAGHMVYGPYARDWGGGVVRAGAELAIDVRDGRTETIVTLELYDATTDEILAQRDIRRVDFGADRTPQWFAIDTDLAGRSGHAMEFRIWWADRAAVWAYRTAVVATP